MVYEQKVDNRSTTLVHCLICYTKEESRVTVNTQNNSERDIEEQQCKWIQHTQTGVPCTTKIEI